MTTRKKDISLPPGVQAMGLSEIEAARFYGLSPTAFAALDSRYKPRPRRAGDRKIFVRTELESSIMELPYWDEGSGPGKGQNGGDEWSVD